MHHFVVLKICGCEEEGFEPFLSSSNYSGIIAEQQSAQDGYRCNGIQVELATLVGMIHGISFFELRSAGNKSLQTVKYGLIMSRY